MLLKDFYKVQTVREISDGKHEAIIEVNKDHYIFNGHFPGNPVMPGVCMMQIIKELTENLIGTDVEVDSLSNAKFMALINPFENPLLRLELHIKEDADGKVKVKNITYFNETVALKMSMVYRKAV